MKLDTLKKLRGKSFVELRTRGRQAATAFAERINAANKLPSDADFWRLFRRDAFGGATPDSELLLANFRRNKSFLLEFDAADIELFRARFPASAAAIVERAERILTGKFDLLGFQNLDFGATVDSRFEPLAGKRSALKHWKKFNDQDTAETGDYKIVWELNRHQHFFLLGAAYKLTCDERFAHKFVEHLNGWIEQNPPKSGVNWMSSLEIGFRAISWLWAFRFFKTSPALTAEIFARALKTLYLQLRHIEQFLSTFYSPNTHLTGEALALYYAGALLPEFRRAAGWRAIGKRILLEELDKQIYDDGVYFEQSTWYQRYTAEFYQHFLLLGDAIRDFTPIERARVADKLQLALGFMLHTTRPDGSAPLVGDDDGGRMLPLEATTAANDFRSTLATGAAQFAREDYKFAAANNCETVFWLFGATGLQKFDELKERAPIERSRLFRRGGYFATRSDWTKNADFLLFDCGRHGALSGAHAHADALAFELAINGAPVLIDAGAYTYHESIELRNHFRSTAAHNALTIDNKSSSEAAGKFAWKSTADATVENTIQNERFDFVRAKHNGFSATLASNEIVSHARSIFFLRGDYTVLLDEIEITGAHEFALNFHFAPQIKVENASANRIFGAPENRAQSAFQIASFGANGAWQTSEDWIAPCYGSRVRAALATFRASGVGAQKFFTFLLPARNQSFSVVEKSTAAADCFAIESKNYRDWIVCKSCQSENRLAENDLFESDFDFAWARIDKQTNDLTEAVLINGKRFCFRGKTIFDAPQTLQFARGQKNGVALQFESGETQFSL